MFSLLWNAIITLLMPGGLILISAVGFLRPEGLPPWLHQPMAAIPYIVVIAGLTFGWYFSSSRMILSLLVLAAVDRALVTFPLSDTDPMAVGQIIFAVTAFLVPLNLLAFSIFNEDRNSTIRGIARVVVVLAQPFLVLWLCLPERQELAAIFTQLVVPTIDSSWTPIPQPALLVFGIASVLQLIRFALRRDPLDGGALWTLIAVFLAYHGIKYGWSPSNFFSTAGFILFVTLLQSTYQRTYRDELTGIPGRLAFEEAVSNLSRTYAVAVIGIDQLKRYANTHGRSVSEQLLKLIAPKIQANSDGGQVFRISGDELTVLFTRHTVSDTLIELERVRKAIESTNLVLRGRDRVREDRRATKRGGSREQELPVTLSIGVAEKSSDQASFSLVVKSAYRALYEAKNAGGNVVKRGQILPEVFNKPYRNSGRMVASGT